jgi:hypothetical protein
MALEGCRPMDEKTEQLRDLFDDIADEDVVTESQSDDRGSLLDADDETVDSRLTTVISEMRTQYEFVTDLDDDRLVPLIRGFYRGDSDEEIAAELETTTRDIETARFDLHLLRDDDLDTEFDLTAFRTQSSDGASDSELATEFEISETVAARYRRAVQARDEARRVSHRFTSAFEDTLAEAALSTQLTADIQETGLEEATEDIDSLDSDADISM